LNIYVVVEGEKGAKKLYKNWIPFVNKNLSNVEYLRDLDTNNFYVIAGYGQTTIYDRIESAIIDVNNNNGFDRLVIGIDSEEKTAHDKFVEVRDFVDKIGCNKDARIVVQHFCLEAWLLANSHLFRKNPQDLDLIEYYHHYDIRSLDPEELPGYNDWNRSQFAYQYLRTGMRDKRFERGTRISYTKTNPGSVVQRGYFEQVLSRHNKRGQILNFRHFLTAFSD